MNGDGKKVWRDEAVPQALPDSEQSPSVSPEMSTGELIKRLREGNVPEYRWDLLSRLIPKRKVHHPINWWDSKAAIRAYYRDLVQKRGLGKHNQKKHKQRVKEGLCRE